VRPQLLAVPKLVYDFTEGNKDLKDLLGGKGANLAEMTNLGLPVPPGFIITTEACRYYLQKGSIPAGLDAEVTEHLRQLERRWAGGSATTLTRCWSACGPAPSSRCRE
jgi:phosphoenolpyruvate synthase/pyruvate phosphate dikinase